MSTNSAKKGSGHRNRGPKWDDVKKSERRVPKTSGTPESGSLPMSQNVAIDTANSPGSVQPCVAIDTSNSPGFLQPGVASSPILPQEESIATPSAEDLAVAEAIDAIEELTSDFDATSIEAGPSKRTPKATKQRKKQNPKLETTAGPSQKKESGTCSVNDSPKNTYNGPFPTDAAYENNPASSDSSIWEDDQSWNTPNYLSFDPTRLLVFRMKPQSKTMRQRFASMKQKAVEIATDTDWVKGAMASMRIKAGGENSRRKEKNDENSRTGSKDTSDLSLRGGAGDISSLNRGGSDIFGFGGGSDACVSIYAHTFTQHSVHLTM